MGINPFDAFKPCPLRPPQAQPEIYPTKTESLLKKGMEPAKTHYGAHEFSNHLANSNLKYLPNCYFPTALSEFLTKDKVREQLLIPAAAPKWEVCKNINYIVNKTTSTFKYYEALEKKNVRVLKFSGSADFTIPTQNTRRWVDDLGLVEKTHWTQYFVKDQVGGYYETLGTNGQFTFATVHGAGLQAAVSKPDVVYYIVSNFIKGK